MEDAEWEALWHLVKREISAHVSRDGRNFDTCVREASDGVMDVVEQFIEAGRFRD